MADSDSDNIGSLLKDIGDMDDELFGRKKDNKHAAPRRGLANFDNLFGDFQKAKKTKRNIDDFFPNKKPTVSFLDELSDAEPQGQKQAKATNKNIESEHLSAVDGMPNQTTVADHSTRFPGRTTNMEDIFKSIPRQETSSRLGKSAGAKSNTEENERIYGLKQSTPTNQKSDINEQLVISGYDRTQRLENEIDRLNREIDNLKQKQTEQEEALIEEWKEKLKRKARQHDQELADLEEDQRRQINRLKSDNEEMFQSLREKFFKQIEVLMEGQKGTKTYEEMVKEMNDMTLKIGEIIANLNNRVDKSGNERDNYISFREQQLTVREERIRKEEEWLAVEKRQVCELNNKLQNLYDKSEQNILQEKWRIREERQKLNAEKEAFKNEQLKILDSAEQQRIEIESSKCSFLREQHDLIIRVIAAKSSFEAEKSAFDAQRDRDVKRLKMEAEQLDQKLKQVRNAEDVLQNTQRIYEQKYQQLVAFEQALIDECFELERIRKQMRLIQNDIQKNTKLNVEHTKLMTASLDTNAPDLVIDPYTDEGLNRREKESYNAILKMHAGYLEGINSIQNNAETFE